MKFSMNLVRVAASMVLAVTAVSITTIDAVAQRGGILHRGTVVMKGAQSSKGVKSEGVGHVVLHGAYYVAPTIDVILQVKHLEVSNIADGQIVYVTLEYLNGNIVPLVAGSITVLNGAGTLTTTKSLNVNTTSTFTTMSLRTATGEVIMSGSIKGLP